MLIERSDEEATQRLLNGTTWEQFCDGLKMAGMVISRDSSPQDPLTQAEGYRYLSRITRAALETFVEHADPSAPVLQRVVHETAKMGSDNPDNYYMNAAVHGDYVYRIRGRRGTVFYLGFGTQKGHYGQGAGMPPVDFKEARDLEIAPDGSFEIIVGGEERPGNWLRLAPGDGTLIVRQTFNDRAGEELAELSIEPIGGASIPSPVTAAAIDRGLGTAAALVGNAAALFANWAEEFTAHTNELPEFDRDKSNRAGGDPNIVYYHSYWRLAPDEALVIEVTPPECELWNFQLNNHWMESLDYRYFPITVNRHTARYRADGSVRVVVAHRDPGVENWITTAGHDRGTMCWRWIRAESHPQPQTRVVKIEAL